MAGMNRRAGMERLGLVPSILENPEGSAMTEICEILRKLPDGDSRLSVMRWSFGRFKPEFKRPVAGGMHVEPAAPPAQAPMPVLVAVPASVPLPAPVPVPDPMDATDIRAEIAAVAPEMTAPL